MLGFEDLKISILENKVAVLEKRIGELEAFVKIFEKRGAVENCCDPEFMVPSDREGSDEKMSVEKVSDKRDDLKPCPFCGGKARIFECEKTGREVIKAEALPEKYYVVGCDDSNCILYMNEFGGANMMLVFLSEEAAAMKWNRRVKKNE